MASRWRGQPGRLEVWYTTLSDPATGTGGWLHHELVAPADRGPAYAHGWVAVFPPDGEPVFDRFGRCPWQPADGLVFLAGPVQVGADRLTGRVGDIRWDLTMNGGGRPLFTFPRWAWHRELLPAALRLDGVDHPGGDPLLATLRLRADVNLPTWRVRGRIGDHQLDVTVTQPAERTITVEYRNPDGTRAVCRNTERATAEITWRPRTGPAARRWRLDGTAHAEVGGRE